MEGMKIGEIAKILQVHKSTVYTRINEFQREGEKSYFTRKEKEEKRR